MKQERSTPPRTDADIYRLAAQKLERGKEVCGCCHAIDKSGGFGYLPTGRHARVMLEFYPEGMRGGWGTYPAYGGESGPRIIALCLLAAMVEAGDA